MSAEISFTRSVHLPAPPDVVCRWHENPHNLRVISPPWLKIHEVRAESSARVGAEFYLHVTQLGFPLRWRGVWREVNRPHLLVDGAIASPFAEWRHEHHFAPDGPGTLMTDVVRCRLGSPWGCFPGRRLALQVVFVLMFAGRHQATREFFKKQTVANIPPPDSGRP